MTSFLHDLRMKLFSSSPLNGTYTFSLQLFTFLWRMEVAKTIKILQLVFMYVTQVHVPY